MTKDDLRRRLQRVVRQSPYRDKIRKISLFGSHLHGDARSESDIDLLIEISDDEMGAFEFIGIERYLSEHLGKKVDLVEPDALSKFIRDDVLGEALPIYEA